MSWYLQISVDRGSDDSLANQVITQIKQLIRDKVLRPGVRLPSSRQLAADLAVSRSVVVEAYQQLVAEGWLLSSQRSGTWVAQGLEPWGPEPQRSEPQRPEPQRPEPRGFEPHGLDHGAVHLPTSSLATGALNIERWDLRTGGVDVTGFPRREWLASLQTVLRHAGCLDLDYPPVAGHPVLRGELVDYLGRVRGVRATAPQFMITVGFAQGLSLLCHLFARLGLDAIGLEDPGQPSHQAFIEKIGLRTVPIPVDEDGIDVATLAASDVRAVLVTPAHQFPTGAPLAPRRRRALLQWAHRVDGLIIEDDYDGEFWYSSGSRLPSLQSMDPDRVVYGGTASKTLAPGLRLGWLCVPPALVDELRRTRERYDLGAGSIDQLAYADFVRTGRLDRHLRRMRARYGSRRRTLAAVLSEHLPHVRLSGPAAGIHAYLRLPPHLDEPSLVAAALHRRVLVHGVGRYRISRRCLDPALVVGYTTQPKTALVEAVQALGAAARELEARSKVVPVRATDHVRSRPA
jgi:GntR family transcriptional regulator / MocR family aminotransferase